MVVSLERRRRRSSVPSVVGETLGQARAVLEASGFRVKDVKQRRPAARARAGARAVAAPGKAPQGSTVTLTVAKALADKVSGPRLSRA